MSPRAARQARASTSFDPMFCPFAAHERLRRTPAGNFRKTIASFWRGCDCRARTTSCHDHRGVPGFGHQRQLRDSITAPSGGARGAAACGRRRRLCYAVNGLS
jgi:hypothetical protein